METYIFRSEFTLGDMLVRPVHIRKEQLRTFIPAHRHSKTSYELHYTAKGCGTVIVNGSRYGVEAGDLYITGPEQIHEQTCDPRDPILEYCLYINCETKGHGSGTLSLIALRSADFHIVKDSKHVFCDYFEEMLNEKRSGLSDSEETACALMRLLLLRLNRESMGRVAGTSIMRSSGAADYPDIEDAFFYRYKTLRLEEVANMLRLSPRQTQRFLLTHYNKTFSEKRKEARMSAAAQLLEDRSLSITEISVRVGFSSVEHFSSAFTAFYGVSPRAYRKNIEERK